MQQVIPRPVLASGKIIFVKFKHPLTTNFYLWTMFFRELLDTLTQEYYYLLSRSRPVAYCFAHQCDYDK